MNVEAEIRNLNRRVSELEGSPGFGLLTRQISSLHRNLLAFRKRTEKRFDQIDARFDKIDGKFDGLEGRVDTLDQKITKVLPGIIRDALRRQSS